VALVVDKLFCVDYNIILRKQNKTQAYYQPRTERLIFFFMILHHFFFRRQITHKLLALRLWTLQCIRTIFLVHSRKKNNVK